MISLDWPSLASISASRGKCTQLDQNIPCFSEYTHGVDVSLDVNDNNIIFNYLLE